MFFFAMAICTLCISIISAMAFIPPYYAQNLPTEITNQAQVKAYLADPANFAAISANIAEKKSAYLVALMQRERMREKARMMEIASLSQRNAALSSALKSVSLLAICLAVFAVIAIWREIKGTKPRPQPKELEKEGRVTDAHGVPHPA